MPETDEATSWLLKMFTSPEAVIWQNTPSHGASCDLPSLFSGMRLFWTPGLITQFIYAVVEDCQNNDGS